MLVEKAEVVVVVPAVVEEEELGEEALVTGAVTVLDLRELLVVLVVETRAVLVILLVDMPVVVISLVVLEGELLVVEHSLGVAIQEHTVD